MDIKKKREADILAVACRVFRERGYHQARMAEIAKEAGISYGLVYHYYKNKADLFDAFLDQWWGDLYEILERKVQHAAHIREKLSAIIDYFLDKYEESPDQVHIFIMEVSRSTANLTPDRLATFKKWISHTETLVAEAQKRGELRKDIHARYLTTFFLGALEAILSTMVLDNRPIRGRAQKARIAENLLVQFFAGAGPTEP